MKLVIMAVYMFALEPGVNRSFEAGMIPPLGRELLKARRWHPPPVGDARVRPAHDEPSPGNAIHWNRLATVIRKPVPVSGAR
jgi:hypothetical protein